MYSLGQKLFVEFIGTFTLVFAGVGSICADQYLRANGQTNVGLLAIALANGLAMGVMVSAIAHISGGHFNPAITIGFWVTRRLGTMKALFYCIAQLLGALAAAFLLVTVIPESVWRPVALGTPDLVPIDFTRMHAMMLEALLTFILVFVFFATMVDPRSLAHRLSWLRRRTHRRRRSARRLSLYGRRHESCPYLRTRPRRAPLVEPRSLLGRPALRRCSRRCNLRPISSP